MGNVSSPNANFAGKTFNMLQKTCRPGFKDCIQWVRRNFLRWSVLFRKVNLYLNFIEWAKVFWLLVVKTVLGLLKLQATCWDDELDINLFFNFSLRTVDIEQETFSLLVFIFWQSCQSCNLCKQRHIERGKLFFFLFLLPSDIEVQYFHHSVEMYRQDWQKCYLHFEKTSMT